LHGQRLDPFLAAIPGAFFTAADTSVGVGFSFLGRLRYAARNHLVAEVVYDGVRRAVEPYSLRRPKTGNLLLYVFEQRRGGVPSGKVKAFKLDGISTVAVTAVHFTPRYRVEL
jgi:hypothetical protein